MSRTQRGPNDRPRKKPTEAPKREEETIDEEEIILDVEWSPEWPKEDEEEPLEA